MTRSLQTVFARISLVVVCAMAVAAVGTAPARSAPVAPRAAASTSGSTLVAAGDIIGTCSGSSCGYYQTASLIKSLNPPTVLALGDISNRSGAASDYTNLFNGAWGSFKSKIHPAVGNHDYGAAGAKNYFSYFGAAAHGPSGYYSFNLGSWHIIALNSNCGHVSCAAGSAQETWLKSDLASHHVACTLAFWHHPRYSSGYGGNNTSMSAIFQDLYNARADVVLSGHSHDYERFAPQNNSSQQTANGITQFVVGTGGAEHTGFGSVKPNSLVRNNTTFGVLRMTLSAGSYSWKFYPVAGKTFTDSGSASCH